MVSKTTWGNCQRLLAWPGDITSVAWLGQGEGIASQWLSGDQVMAGGQSTRKNGSHIKFFFQLFLLCLFFLRVASCAFEDRFYYAYNLRAVSVPSPGGRDDAVDAALGHVQDIDLAGVVFAKG